MQLVGVYLVFVSVIIPARAARKINTRGVRLASAYGVGIVGYLSGLVLSTHLDMPAGAVIVRCLASVAILFAWVIQPTLIKRDARTVSLTGELAPQVNHQKNSYCISTKIGFSCVRP